eukprot:3751012-Lingulodinium_polyedra.AAC.1
MANTLKVPPGPSSPGAPCSLPLLVATGNVLTLEPGQHQLAKAMGLVQTAKMAHIQQQLIDASI